MLSVGGLRSGQWNGYYCLQIPINRITSMAESVNNESVKCTHEIRQEESDMVHGCIAREMFSIRNCTQLTTSTICWRAISNLTSTLSPSSKTGLTLGSWPFRSVCFKRYSPVRLSLLDAGYAVEKENVMYS